MGRIQGGMAVEGSGGHGVTLEAHLRWCWGCRQPGSQPSSALPSRPPRQATGVLGVPGLADSWVTSQLRSGGTLQAHRRLALCPRSRLTLTMTWPQGLKGPWPAVPWALATLSAHTVLGEARPWPGRPSCPTAVGLKPLGATIESARPLRPNKATLSPTPTAEQITLRLVTGRPGEPVRPTTPLPPPAMMKRWRVGFFWRELWRDTRADRWLRRGWALVGSARGRSRGSRASQFSPGPAAESGSSPATP